MPNAYVKSLTDRAVLPIARGMARIGITPNWLTFAGLVLTVAGMAIVLAGARITGAVVLAVGSLIDGFDGAVARQRNAVSAFGSFYDSVADRVGDAVIFAGLAWMVRDEPWLFSAAMLAFASALITSYVRAKAESLGWSATVGLVERPERLTVVVAALAFDVVAVGVVVLAVGGLVTVAQRVWTVWRQAGRPGPASRSGRSDGGDEGRRGSAT